MDLDMDTATTTEHEVRVFCKVAGSAVWREVASTELQSEEYLFGRRHDDIPDSEE